MDGPSEAYTFAFADGENPVDTLAAYVSNLARLGCSDRIDALGDYVKRLQVGQQRLRSKQAEGDSRDGANNTMNLSMDKYVKMLLRKSEHAPKRLGPGEERDEEIRTRLEQGQSFFDIASHLQRAVLFIELEAKRILGSLELESILRKNKKPRSDPWSDAEIKQLQAWRQQNQPLSKIRKWLRRTKPSINKRLKELWGAESDQKIVEGPQEIPVALQRTLFHDRMAEILDVLMESDMTETWRATLQKRSVQAWVSTISERVPEEVQKLLGNVRSPTWEEIEGIPLIKTIRTGVYARLATSQYELGLAHDRYLYVGSASRYGGGLIAKMEEHVTNERSRIQRDIKRRGLKGREGRFVTLMVMNMESQQYDAVLDARRTVTLAEAIFTVWLGALKSPTMSHQSAYPWDIDLRQYTG